MLKIKSTQLEAFAAINREIFIEKLILLLRTEFESAENISDEEFKRVIPIQINRANRYLIFLDVNIAKYVISAFLMGEEFDEKFNGAKKILEQIRVHENKKTEELEEWTLQIFENLENNND